MRLSHTDSCTKTDGSLTGVFLLLCLLHQGQCFDCSSGQSHHRPLFPSLSAFSFLFSLFGQKDTGWRSLSPSPRGEVTQCSLSLSPPPCPSNCPVCFKVVEWMFQWQKQTYVMVCVCGLFCSTFNCGDISFFVTGTLCLRGTFCKSSLSKRIFWSSEGLGLKLYKKTRHLLLYVNSLYKGNMWFLKNHRCKSHTGLLWCVEQTSRKPCSPQKWINSQLNWVYVSNDNANKLQG